MQRITAFNSQYQCTLSFFDFFSQMQFIHIRLYPSYNKLFGIYIWIRSKVLHFIDWNIGICEISFGVISSRIGVAFHEKWKWWIKNKERKRKIQQCCCCCCFSFPFVRFSITREHKCVLVCVYISLITCQPVCLHQCICAIIFECIWLYDCVHVCVCLVLRILHLLFRHLEIQQHQEYV